MSLRLSQNRIRLLIASHNKDKIREIKTLINDDSVEILTISDFNEKIPDVNEDQNTLLGNALKKAKTIADAVDFPTIADDTGLFVDALDGRPGVYSARYAGESCTYADNRIKMLKEMDGLNERDAHFKTVVVLYFPDGREIMAEGIVEGYITESERGDNGFGYDAIFQPKGSEKTFAEMNDFEKNSVSHRARALKSLIIKMKENNILR